MTLIASFDKNNNSISSLKGIDPPNYTHNSITSGASRNNVAPSQDSLAKVGMQPKRNTFDGSYNVPKGGVLPSFNTKNYISSLRADTAVKVGDAYRRGDITSDEASRLMPQAAAGAGDISMLPAPPAPVARPPMRVDGLTALDAYKQTQSNLPKRPIRRSSGSTPLDAALSPTIPTTDTGSTSLDILLDPNK